MSESLGDILAEALARHEAKPHEVKQFDPYGSGKSKDERPTLEQVAAKVIDVVQGWDQSRNDPDFVRHASDGPLQLSAGGVEKFKGLIAENGDNVGTEVFESVTELFVNDMMADRPGLGEHWREALTEAKLREGRFSFDNETVGELMRNEDPLEVENRAGEGWQKRDWAVKFAEQGFDVSGQKVEDQVYFEAVHLGMRELDDRDEMRRMQELHERSAIEQSGGVSCPSCGGLNTSCPDGCGRDPKTGELNGTRLEQETPTVSNISQEDLQAGFAILDRVGAGGMTEKALGEANAELDRIAATAKAPAELGSITYVGEGLAERDEDFRRAYMLPGEEVRLNPKMDISYVDMGALEGKFGDDVLKIEDTRLTLTENAWIKPEYKFEGHDGYHTAQAFEHPNGLVHEFGIMAERDDKLFFVPMTDLDGQAKGAAREVVGLEGRYAEHSVPEGLGGFTADVKQEPKSGEISFVPVERGSEAGPVRLAGIPWMSGVSEKELEVANKAIDQVLGGERKPGGLLQQAEALRSNVRSPETREDKARSLMSLSQGPSNGSPQMPARSIER